MVKGKQKYKVILETRGNKTSRTVLAKNMNTAESQVSKEFRGRKHRIINVIPL